MDPQQVPHTSNGGMQTSTLGKYILFGGTFLSLSHKPFLSHTPPTPQNLTPLPPHPHFSGAIFGKHTHLFLRLTFPHRPDEVASV